MALNDFVNPLNININVNLTEAVYLLSATVNGFGNQTVEPTVSEVCTLQCQNNYNTTSLQYAINDCIYHVCTNVLQLILSIASQILDIAQNRVENGVNVSYTG